MTSSEALREWRGERSARLDAVEALLRRMGAARSRQHSASQDMNRAYVILLAAQFQRFCGDLHVECVDVMVQELPPDIKVIVVTNFLQGRQLDKGNAQPGNLGSDFGRLGVQLWPELKRWNPRCTVFQELLLQLNIWRNAIAHDDFSAASYFPKGNHTMLRLSLVRRWRQACNRLAPGMDTVMRDYVLGIKGASSW